MKRSALIATSVSLWLVVTPATASPSQFKFRRAITNVAGGRNYIAIDEIVRRHARHDLADLRLFTDAGTVVPYALRIMREETSRQPVRTKIVNLGSAGGRTVFEIDVPPGLEYDAIDLGVSRRDFIADVTVEGLPRGRATVDLGRHVLYERSADRLGASTTIRLRTSSFERLLVSISEPVEPGDLTSVSLHASRRTPAVWSALPHRVERADAEQQTSFRWSSDAPAERVVLHIAPQQNDFSRTVRLVDENERTVATSEVHRVTSNATPVVRSERLAIDVPLPASKIIIDNGDDAPLAIENVQLLTAERRLYFDTPGENVILYYGNEAATPPRYDYARLFREAPATRATLGAHTVNDSFRDPRPFTERHPAVLWLALVAAIAVLGTIAFRELRQPNL